MVNKELSTHCLLTDQQGSLIYSTINPECNRCIAECGSHNELTQSCGIPGKRRRGIKLTDYGQAFLCSNQPEHTESSKSFKKELDFCAQMIERFTLIKQELSNQEAKKTNRLFHNLVSINAHTIQELYALVSQDDLSTSPSFKEQVEIVKKKLSSDLHSSAVAFLKVLKNETSLKSEFSVYSKLYDPNPVLRFARHSIHKVILNVANLFFQDFADKGIRLIIFPSDIKLKLDYDSIQVALFHLFDNASKYSEANSEIKVLFHELEHEIRIEIIMSSLFIGPDETIRIFEEGFSGEQPKIIKSAGKGIGMGLTRELLNLNDAVITVIPGKDKRSPISKLTPKGVTYTTNSFIIIFGSKKHFKP